MNINAKVIRRGATAVAAVAVMGAMGACSANGTLTVTPASPGATTSSSAAAQGTNTSGGATQGTDTKGTPVTNGQGSGGSGGHPACANMKVSDVSPDVTNGGSQWKLPIKLINQGSTACTVQGFPGVRLNGADGTTWDLVRTGDPITPVLLAPGEFAIADLTYLTAGSDDGGKGWHVSTVSITPPNGTNTQTIPWADSLDLVKQDAATHPGTYIGPAHAGR
ncbi:DUF4232 domain-containing protein [Kutzneria sp. CA-103260]|uniref:DUF4232 domain-containing protein n=1 Tax=Kutzneria sp. CA-103260 TaxID=2802641 RepID=UPI001BAA3851|nr:DUF4232 domain-containing protein [Kutzneria sp. CA-103260]QUQ71830.1 hypothetical protein JJ691_96170 [Kutzneria sp. CA-103260]